jgi:hypothetical protein
MPTVVLTEFPQPVPADSASPSHSRPVRAFFTDSSLFKWGNLSLREDAIFMLAIAICLGVGVAAKHPAAGMIAAGGAMTVGLGAKQRIDDSRLLPMIFAALGISLSTFIGMVAGHRSFILVAIAVLGGFGYGLLASRPAGYFWVGQQCVIYMLVGSAFPSSPTASAVRSLLMLAGGTIQVLLSSILLRLSHEMRQNLLDLSRYARTEELLLRATLIQATDSLRHGRIDSGDLLYALRVAITLGASTWIYIHLHFQSGYWIPMTALLVLKPGLTDTVNRAIARTFGTMLGAVLGSFALAQIPHPSPVILAACTLICVWLAYGTLNVNYALYSTWLTAYIVFLLSLDGIAGTVIAERRTVATAIGGALALAVRLTVLRYRLHQKRSNR